jgi:hypothetical protein
MLLLKACPMPAVMNPKSLLVIYWQLKKSKTQLITIKNKFLPEFSEGWNAQFRAIRWPGGFMKYGRIRRKYLGQFRTR